MINNKTLNKEQEDPWCRLQELATETLVHKNVELIQMEHKDLLDAIYQHNDAKFNILASDEKQLWTDTLLFYEACRYGTHHMVDKLLLAKPDKTKINKRGLTLAINERNSQHQLNYPFYDVLFKYGIYIFPKKKEFIEKLKEHFWNDKNKIENTKELSQDFTHWYCKEGLFKYPDSLKKLEGSILIKDFLGYYISFYLNKKSEDLDKALINIKKQFPYSMGKWLSDRDIATKAWKNIEVKMEKDKGIGKLKTLIKHGVLPYEKLIIGKYHNPKSFSWLYLFATGKKSKKIFQFLSQSKNQNDLFLDEITNQNTINNDHSNLLSSFVIEFLIDNKIDLFSSRKSKEISNVSIAPIMSLYLKRKNHSEKIKITKKIHDYLLNNSEKTLKILKTKHKDDHLESRYIYNLKGKKVSSHKYQSIIQKHLIEQSIKNNHGKTKPLKSSMKKF